MANPNFPYEDLDASIPEIRLLTIHPGLTDDLITCSLEVVPLHKCQFEALSYVWGDTAKTSAITVSGLAFKVTQNLFAALPNLRSEDHARVFWIDAICINQSDPEEQSSQVSLMGDVYRNALPVVVWLGECKPESDNLFTFFSSRAVGKAEEGKPLQILEKDGDAAAKALYYDLGRRSWLRRVWIIQEMALARRIVVRCGRYEMDWDTLLDQWSSLERASTGMTGTSGPPGGYDWSDLAKTLPRLARTRELVQQAMASSALLPSIGELLAWHRTFEATMPRDKVYGLLGLRQKDENGLHSLLSPDYTQNTTDLHVFIKAVEFCIEQDGRLDILTLGSAGNHKAGPSWVPNWASKWTPPASPSMLLLQKYNINPPLTLLRTISTSESDSTFHDWRADDRFAPRYSINREQALLNAIGARIDTIAAVGDVCQHPSLDTMFASWTITMIERFPQSMTEVIRVGNQCSKLWTRCSTNKEGGWAIEADGRPTTAENDPYVGGGTIANAYLKAITLGRLFNGKKLGVEECGVFWNVEEEGGEGNEPGNVQGEGQHLETVKGLFNAIKQHPLHRRLLVTQKGYVGLGPASCRQGDTACILLGCAVPMVQRKRKGKFSLIGEAYVQGWMEGEMVQKLKLKEDECMLETFVLG